MAAKGSDGVKGVVDLEVPASALTDKGAGDCDLEGPAEIEALGRGAPLTIWSSFELDMVIDEVTD